MKVDLRPDLMKSWAVFAATLVLGAGFMWWWSDVAQLRGQEERAAAAYQQQLGQLDLAGQVAAQRAANERLASHLSDLKGNTGVREVAPFMVPENYRRPSEYFRVAYDKIREDLLRRAEEIRSSDYDQDLGFGFLADKIPDPDNVDRWLLMLQLVSKAAYLAQSAPDGSLHGISIDDLGSGFAPVLRGAEGRPAHLREYPFRLTVNGSLRDILWLLHQLSAEQPTPIHRRMQRWLGGRDGVADKVSAALGGIDAMPASDADEVSPLVVRGLDISSGNVRADQQVQTLTAIFDLAGLEFIAADEAQPAERRPQRRP
ncbi:MAG: hypothetical protein ACYTF0_03495 [Planctomycetota bacterium]|jgi:hypothetical protein